MTLKLSTGLRNALMTNTADGGLPFAEIFKGGFIDVYKGSRPADADAIESAGTEFLFRVLLDGGATQTSGVLVVGETYKITTYNAGDDFVNVGGANVVNTVFTATGTTPTVYTNSSVLQKVGLAFENAVAGKISKSAAVTWKGIAAAAGVAAWFRFYAGTADIGDSSGGEGLIRFEGQVSTYGGQMNMPSVNVVAATSQTVDTFNVTLPV